LLEEGFEMWLWIVVAVVALLVVFVILIYNRLVGLRNRVRNAWSQIDVQLKRRHDLIPNLVNAVQGYLDHERGVLERVTTARAAAISAGGNVTERAQAENELTQSLRSLFAVAEGYPQLRANENMLALQEELSSTENRVAFARQHYNDSVMQYNTARETFPAVVIASPLGFRHEALFELEDVAERAVPQVQFQ
jgi:LemA protein